MNVTVPAESCSCEVTGYRGHEDEILRLRNANREHAETREYLDWRYATLPGAPEPRVFWLRSETGERIGMAAVIFRPYHVDERRVFVAVLGDISVTSTSRGRGLGRKLLRYTTDWLQNTMPDHLALVIPTESARRSFDAIGWKTVGQLVPHVFPTDMARPLQKVLRSARVAALAGRVLSPLARAWQRRFVMPGYQLDHSRGFDEALVSLWNGIRESGRISREMSVPALHWRYAAHPKLQFNVVTLRRGAEEVAALIFTVFAEHGMCNVYDLIAHSPKDLACLLALFVRECAQREDIGDVRVTLDDRHPYGVTLGKLGFVRRDPTAVFQVQSAQPESGAHWWLTMGDKDI